MWSCPVCSGKQKKEYQCVDCGFDEREDFVGYRTVCRVSEKALEKWQKYGSNKIVEETYSNGIYRGCMKKGKREGQGTYFYSNGNRYEGEWKNGNKEGYGKFYWKADDRYNGDRYEGEYKNDVREGKGTYFYASGNRYEGEWKNNKREGHGKFYWKDGTFRVGEWKEDIMQ